MKKNVPSRQTDSEPRVGLDEIVRDGAQKMLQAALETEIEAFLEQHSGIVDEEGRRQIVRNGHLPERELLTGAGTLSLEQPRARDRRELAADEKIRFSSSILPPYLRRCKNLDELIPWLYLRGISSGDFSRALEALVGPEAKNLSANVVTRLTETWKTEYETWSRRDLSEKTYVYFWADGVYFNVRLDEERQCILVLMGATSDGRKELIGILDGYRESEQNWRELLLDLKARGLQGAPKVAVGDGALGFWAALRKVFSNDARATMLGAQNGQRAEQAPTIGTGQSQGEHPRHLDGRDARRRRKSLRPLHRKVQGEVPRRCRLPGERPRRAPGLLRLPRGALDPPTDDKPDRIHVRHRASPSPTYEGKWNTCSVSRDGLQARTCRGEKLATIELPASALEDSRGLQLCRWNHAREGRRLILRPQHSTVSPTEAAVMSLVLVIQVYDSCARSAPSCHRRTVRWPRQVRSVSLRGNA